jgi:DNA-binding CsgD family transcriptional regulator
MRLGRTDLEAILGFLVDVNDIQFDEPWPVEVLARLRRLVPCDALSYQELDVRSRRFLDMVALTPDDDDDEDEALYWTVGPCPITDYRARTGDLTAVRMSDVIGGQRYHESLFYREYFRPVGLDKVIDLGMSAKPERIRSFVLIREASANDFSERDRAVLELLRPHLRALEARASLHRLLSDSTIDSDEEQTSTDAPLTAREREILLLVGEGKTNAQIAALLWVAPSTVKKHLEHVYEKTGIGRRAAAASRVYAGH